MDFLDEVAGSDAEAAEEDDFDLFEIYEDSPDVEIPYDLIAKLEQKEIEDRMNKPVAQGVINLQNMKEAASKWQHHEKDCGSTEVQVARLQERVKYLTTHLLQNPKDVNAKRGLNLIVNQRRKLLNFLYETNKPKAEEMVSQLGIRFRAPGRLWDKESKYGAFKNTKSKWQKIRQQERIEKRLEKERERLAALTNA